MPDTTASSSPTKVTAQSSAKPPSPSSFPKCRVVEQPDGGLRVEFLIEPAEAERLRKRAYLMKLDTYLWENVLKQAISSACY